MEDGETDGDDEREERQLQRVEGFDAQDAEAEGHEGDGLQQNESQNWDCDFLQFGFPRLAGGVGVVELDLEVDLVVVEVARRNGHFRFGDRQMNGHIVPLDELAEHVQHIARRSARFVRIPFNLNVAQNLRKNARKCHFERFRICVFCLFTHVDVLGESAAGQQSDDTGDEN